MTTSPRLALRINDPGEVLATVPTLLGFHPMDSVVLVTVSRADPRTEPRALPTGDPADRWQIGPVLRTDLPPPGASPPALRSFADAIAQRLVTCRAAGMVILVVGSGSSDSPVDPPDVLPHRDLVHALSAAATTVGVTTADAVWVPEVATGVTWWCYTDAECTGQVRDPATSVIAAALAVEGAVVFANRTELAGVLDQRDAAAIARCAALIDAIRGRPPGPGAGQDADLRLVLDAIDELAEAPTMDLPGPAGLDDERIARLAVALSDPDVRDSCLGLALGARALAAERLWTLLTRALPPPERAGTACLLAVSAFLRGDGAMAAVAADTAMDADPGNHLAWMLKVAGDNGLHPDRLREMVVASQVQADVIRAGRRRACG